MGSESTDKHESSPVESSSSPVESSSSPASEPSSPVSQNPQETAPEQPKAKKNNSKKEKGFLANAKAGFDEAEAERQKKAQGKKGSGNAHVAALEQGEESFEKIAWSMAKLGYKTDVATLQFAGKKLKDLYHSFRAEEEKTPEEVKAIDEELEHRASQSMPGEEMGSELTEWRPSPSASSNDPSKEEAYIEDDREDDASEEMDVDDNESAVTDSELDSDEEVDLTPIADIPQEDKPQEEIDPNDPLGGVTPK